MVENILSLSQTKVIVVLSTLNGSFIDLFFFNFYFHIEL